MRKMNGKRRSEKLDQMLAQLITDLTALGQCYCCRKWEGIGWRVALLAGWRKRVPRMEGALQQEYLLWVPSCRARASLHIPSGSTAGVLRGGQGEIVIHKYCFEHSPNSASFNPPNNPKRQVLSFAILQKGNTSIKVLTDLHTILLLVSGRTGIHTQG